MPKIPRIARPSFVSVATFLLLIVFSLTITSLGKWLLSLKDEQKVSSCFSQQEEIHVLKFLKNRGLEQYNNTFIDKKVKGSLFLLLTLNELEEHFLITSPFHARYVSCEILCLFSCFLTFSYLHSCNPYMNLIVRVICSADCLVIWQLRSNFCVRARQA